MATNGLPTRGLPRCKARATSSLPVPLSPVINTVEMVGAMRAMRACSSRIFELSLRRGTSQAAARAPLRSPATPVHRLPREPPKPSARWRPIAAPGLLHIRKPRAADTAGRRLHASPPRPLPARSRPAPARVTAHAPDAIAVSTLREQRSLRERNLPVRPLHNRPGWNP